MSVMSKKSKLGSARRQIGIKSASHGVIEFANNQYRMILESSSVNFELKSEQEQDAIIDTYRQFLNSLSFPVQILIRVRELSVETYLKTIAEKAEVEKEEIYKTQLLSYIEFIQGFMKQNKVLARKFYFVVSASGKPKEKAYIEEKLALNADIIQKGLARLGITMKRLGSLEALDLFYSFYADEFSPTLPLSEQTLNQLQEVLV